MFVEFYHIAFATVFINDFFFTVFIPYMKCDDADQGARYLLIGLNNP